MALPIPSTTNYAPVTVAVFASAVAAVAMKYLKVKLGVDFADMEPHIQTIAIGLAYFVTGKSAK